jgi:nicotinate-nucleotide adenylyltransferase
MPSNKSYHSSKYSLLPVRLNNAKVGLLGGSFNPPHYGHVHITLEAIKKFNLSYVFWLVTPHNPFKDIHTYALLSERVEKSIQITKPYSNKIKITDIEKFFRNTYSANTVQNINRMHSKTSFYWIMGGDNIFHMHKWFMWQRIFRMTKVALCERNDASFKVKNTRMFNIFDCQHLHNMYTHHNHYKTDFFMLHTKKIAVSSTEIRNKKK